MKYTYEDRDGRVIEDGFRVEVPAPNEDDLYNYEFVGTVVGFKEKGLVIVIDQDDNEWDIEAERVRIEED